MILMGAECNGPARFTSPGAPFAEKIESGNMKDIDIIELHRRLNERSRQSPQQGDFPDHCSADLNALSLTGSEYRLDPISRCAPEGGAGRIRRCGGCRARSNDALVRR